MPLAEDRSAIDWGSPLTRGLAACFIPSMRGNCMIDLVSGLQLPAQNGARVQSASAGRVGDCVGAGRGFVLTAPASLKIAYPLSLVWVGVPAQTMVNAPVFGVDANNNNSSPYVAWVLSTQASGVFSCDYTSTLRTIIGTTNSSGCVGKRTTVAANLSSAGSALIVNGAQEATGTAPGAASYSATSLLKLGVYSNTTNNGQALGLMGLIYSRTPSIEEHRSLHRNPWQILTPGTRLALGLIDVPTYLLLMRRTDLLLKGL